MVRDDWELYVLYGVDDVREGIQFGAQKCAAVQRLRKKCVGNISKKTEFLPEILGWTNYLLHRNKGQMGMGRMWKLQVRERQRVCCFFLRGERLELWTNLKMLG